VAPHAGLQRVQLGQIGIAKQISRLANVEMSSSPLHTPNIIGTNRL
jgi:hypothetical protein